MSLPDTMSIDSDTASVQILPFDLNEEPPLYTQDRDADIDINADTHMLDSRLLKEHDYHLVRNGKQWLSLSLKDRARTGDELPHFTQGSTLSGSVRLVLGPKGAVIRSVSVSIIGELTSPVYYSRFLTMTRQLYVSDVNDLDTSLPDPPEVSEGKLDGEHSWPFAIRLPKGIRIVLSDKEGHNFLLPPTLSKHASKVQVKYKLVARVKKGILSSDNRLEAEFDYTPRFRPSQPSILRQIATMENQPLVGPDEDPAGWKVLDPIVLRGKYLMKRLIEALMSNNQAFHCSSPVLCSGYNDTSHVVHYML
ncbi:hypothetical protein EUX98_g4769 [Antrodiella citrinella]|uniref:Arrestin-like N-terminal domain-containing protein n=1 Tax=Antrodiella citrinella TaxID=2447956 RepID=A0A4V3XIJ3_9APHY|nr:hypothetical protein EUX98_g4769 [Antrodiella citrinella]